MICKLSIGDKSLPLKVVETNLDGFIEFYLISIPNNFISQAFLLFCIINGVCVCVRARVRVYVRVCACACVRACVVTFSVNLVLSNKCQATYA